MKKQRRLFTDVNDQYAIIRARQCFAVYQNLEPNTQPNEALWRQYKQYQAEGNIEKCHETILQYIANNKGYFLNILKHYFFRFAKTCEAEEFTTALFEGLSNGFKKSNRYTKSYFVRAIRFELDRVRAKCERKDENIEEYAYEDEEIVETIDRLFSYNEKHEYRALFELVRRIEEETPQKPNEHLNTYRMRLRKLIIAEAERLGLTLLLYEYLTEGE